MAIHKSWFRCSSQGIRKSELNEKQMKKCRNICEMRRICITLLCIVGLKSRFILKCFSPKGFGYTQTYHSHWLHDWIALTEIRCWVWCSQWIVIYFGLHEDMTEKSMNSLPQKRKILIDNFHVRKCVISEGTYFA